MVRGCVVSLICLLCLRFPHTMSDVLRNLKPTTKDCKELIPALLNYLQGFEQRFQSSIADMKNEFTTQIALRDDKISNLESEVKLLNDKIKKIENNADDADAYERRDTVIFSGPALPDGTTTENCSDIVRNLTKTELKINLSCGDISTVHRMGPKPLNQAPDKRPIVVKFCRRDIKRDVVAASRRQARPPSVFVNESLTPIRRKIFNTLRVIKRQHPELVCGVSTFEGRVFAYTKSTSAPQSAATGSRDVRHLVNTYDMLVSFCQNHVHKPINTFLDSWQF